MAFNSVYLSSFLVYKSSGICVDDKAEALCVFLMCIIYNLFCRPCQKVRQETLMNSQLLARSMRVDHTSHQSICTPVGVKEIRHEHQAPVKSSE